MYIRDTLDPFCPNLDKKKLTVFKYSTYLPSIKKSEKS